MIAGRSRGTVVGMTAAAMIQARGLVKHYRSTLAVDHLSFDVRPGTVTGFLGPTARASPLRNCGFHCRQGTLLPRLSAIRVHGSDP